MRKQKMTETVLADPLDNLPVKIVSDEDLEEDDDSEEADEREEADEDNSAYSAHSYRDWILPQRQNRGYNSLMKASFAETLIAVWRQALVDEADVIKLGSERYPVTKSNSKRLRLVTFAFDGNEIMGIEQNPKTKSRWAAMARAGTEVMQFIQDGQYVAAVADGKVTLYGKRAT
jgi:hypothetical protein